MKKCLICGENVKYLARHLKYNHPNYNIKKYYDDFIKGPHEGICLLCGKETKFNYNDYAKGYRKYCSKKCSNLINRPRGPLSNKTKEKISNKRKIYLNTPRGIEFIKNLSESRKGINNPVHKQTKETRDKMALNNSIKMKEKILKGEFTPNITNSWANSKCRLKLADNIYVRSSWEAVFYILNPNCLYEKIRIEYLYKDKRYIYITDFVDIDNKIIYEIKPNSEKNNGKYKEKIKALKKWCSLNNFNYKIISNDWFKENAKKVHYEKYDPKIKKGMKQFL